MDKSARWAASLFRECGIFLAASVAAQFAFAVLFVILELTGLGNWDSSNHAAGVSTGGYLLVKAHARYRSHSAEALAIGANAR
jgi:hypothetical protein